MLPGETIIGFRRNDYYLISKKEREESWIEILKIINQILPGCKIYIKPHPDTPNFDKIKGILESISNNIEVVDPKEPADKYIEIADMIISLPPSMSTTVFTASLQCPEKPILSLDISHELLGDSFKDFDGIEYIDNKEKLINILKTIRDNKYQHKHKVMSEPNGFTSVVGLLNDLFYKKRIRYS